VFWLSGNVIAGGVERVLLPETRMQSIDQDSRDRHGESEDPETGLTGLTGKIKKAWRGAPAFARLALPAVSGSNGGNVNV